AKIVGSSADRGPSSHTHLPTHSSSITDSRSGQVGPRRARARPFRNMPRWLGIACASVALALLVALLPRVGRADGELMAPAVDLEKISFDDEGAKAPLVEGGELAELTLDPLVDRAARRLLVSA